MVRSNSGFVAPGGGGQSTKIGMKKLSSSSVLTPYSMNLNMKPTLSKKEVAKLIRKVEMKA